MKKKERKVVYENLVQEYPVILDYYIKDRDQNKEEASSLISRIIVYITICVSMNLTK